jgi:hypothetical protein
MPAAGCSIQPVFSGRVLFCSRCNAFHPQNRPQDLALKSNNDGEMRLEVSSSVFRAAQRESHVKRRGVGRGLSHMRFRGVEPGSFDNSCHPCDFG